MKKEWSEERLVKQTEVNRRLFQGKPKSDEHKRKISEAKRGVKQTPEHIRKRVESRNGNKIHHSIEA